ncbi:hypothetical protein RUND412_004278 [Rhizina undulata]
MVTMLSKDPQKSHSRTSSAAPSTSYHIHHLTSSMPREGSTQSNRSSVRSASHKSETPADKDKGNHSDVNSSTNSLTNSGVLIPATGVKSVEETVRTFRLYEALRNGDTAGISRAIREGSVDETAGRPSIGSVRSAMVDGNKSQILHLAVQCAELPVVEYILATTSSNPDSKGLPYLDINNRDPTTGNTPLHVAAHLGRVEVVQLLLKQEGINDSLHNYNNRTPLEISRTPAVFQILQMARSLYLEEQVAKLHALIREQNYEGIEELLQTPRVKGLLDLNNLEPPTEDGSTLLHEAARKKDIMLIKILLLHGADPFRRDKKGKLPQDVTKDERTRSMLKKSPEAAAAARGIEERVVLGSAVDSGAGIGIDGAAPVGGKEGREMKGYLKKWTNYTGGYKLRWFVLENGVLSYYKNQEDIGSACRGAINMRIARLDMDPQDKLRFEIHGKSSVKYHLKANHVVEAKRWYWTLNNAIQWAKDEARDEELRKQGEAERMGKLREQQKEDSGTDSPSLVEVSRRASKVPSMAGSEIGGLNRRRSMKPQLAESIMATEDESDYYEPSVHHVHGGAFTDDDADDEGHGKDDDDDTSSHSRAEPPSADALALAANSAKLQLDLLSQVVLALQFEYANNPSITLSDPTVAAALTSYESAVGSLQQLVGDLLKMSKERDSYWRWKMEKELALRRIWEDNMTVLAQEQEALEGRVVGERQRRRKTKRQLREVLRKGDSLPLSRHDTVHEENEDVELLEKRLEEVVLDQDGAAKREREKDAEVILSDTDSSESDQFFDAIDNGEVEVMTEMPSRVQEETIPEDRAAEVLVPPEEKALDLRERKLVAIKRSYKGYEDPPRTRLKMDADDRPKISLWGILKSMIGKDMTKMTLPVSFNEPTSLLQRVAEDMEYTDLLDAAADRADSAERMVYVAAFAASEYSSTINRIAKPFNPLLGETYEYCRPDKNYRFFIEQVSHHPPIGAAWAEGEKWDYWGESAVRSKFYGKSFDINPLGTWFLRLRTGNGEELYTWKKVTSSVVGIITGSPTVDNYGVMEIKNWTTGETCQLEFKARGWRGANAYEVKGRVLDVDNAQVWSVSGRWNDKIYARLSPGSDGNISPPAKSFSVTTTPNAAFLVWENHPRPPAPFNLTPFALTLNALPENLKPFLCPTDTRLRPDQRAMEDGEYDLAATEKNRLEEKQRAKRREREERGEEWTPRWFKKSVCNVTGEEFWEFGGEYWKIREEVAAGGEWRGVEDIF